LVRELRFVLEIGPFDPLADPGIINNKPPNLADISVEIQYMNKPVTGGYVPLAVFSQPRRMYSEFITWNPSYYDPINQPQNPTDLQWWKQLSRVTYRLPVPLLLLTGVAELSIRVVYDDIANVWIGALDTNTYPFTLTTEVVGEEPQGLMTKLPGTADIPYIAAYRTHLTGVPPERFQSSRSDLTNGTRSNLKLHGFTAVIAGDTSSVYYGKTYASLRSSGQSIEDVQTQMLDWKGRTITPISPFGDMIDRVTRKWPARAEIPPNAFFRMLGSVGTTVQAPGQAALLVVGMHGTRNEKL
jgi:hypothetical protein